ncbi:MAG TPA: hypothetical protein PKG97_02535, partial [Mesotoga infera]|nr:hypothetical protein [Mesotoga infera]
VFTPGTGQNRLPSPRFLFSFSFSCSFLLAVTLTHFVWFKEAYLFVIMCGIENTGEEVKV